MWVVSQHFPFHCLLIATKMQSDINIVVVPMLWWISNNLPSLISHQKCEWCFQGPRWSPQANSHSIQASWSVNNPRTRLEKNCFCQPRAGLRNKRTGKQFLKKCTRCLTFWMRKAAQNSVSGTLMLPSLLLFPPSTNQPLGSSSSHRTSPHQLFYAHFALQDL